MKKTRYLVLIFLVMVALVLLTNVDALAQDDFSIASLPIAPSRFTSMEDLLRDVAVWKFGIIDPHVSMPLAVLIGLKDFYIPYAVWQGFSLSEIQMDFFNAPLRITYNRGEDTIRFYWYRREQADQEVSPHIRTMEGSEYTLRWTEHGQVFKVVVPASLTEEEGFQEEQLYAFATAMRLITWEIQGNPLKVYVQGLENINIFDNRGNEVVMEAEDPYFRMMWQTLYRLNYDGTRDRIGLRWIDDEELHRYRFVLAPGIYTFHAEGIIGEPELQVQHFTDHEVASSANFTAALTGESAAQFVLTVDSSATEQTLLVGRDLENLRRFSLTLGSPLITDLLSGTTVTMDTVPVIQQGRTIVPISFVAEKLGAEVDWNPVTRTVTILLDDQQLSLTIGELAPGMDIPAQIIDGRTMVPLRFVTESLGAIVNWNPDARTIEVIR